MLLATCAAVITSYLLAFLWLLQQLESRYGNKRRIHPNAK